MENTGRKFLYLLGAGAIVAVVVFLVWFRVLRKPAGIPVDLSWLTVIWPESRITARIKILTPDGKKVNYNEKMRVRTFIFEKEEGLRKVFREILTTDISPDAHGDNSGSEKLPPGPSYLTKLYDSRWRNRKRFAGRAEIFDLVRAATGDSCVLPPRPVAVGETWNEKIGYGDFAGTYAYTYLGNSGGKTEQIRCIGKYTDLENGTEIGTIAVTTSISTLGNVSDNRLDGIFSFRASGMEYTEHFVESGCGEREFPDIDHVLRDEIALVTEAVGFFRQKNLESALKILENYRAKYPDGRFTGGVRLLRKKIRRKENR
ncbi:MAG: hypothetical protein ACYS8W_18565 [Planctomycetota bacterium]|jgi:hypothetical protein